MDKGQGEAVLATAIWDSDQDQFLNSTWKNLLDLFPASMFPARQDRKLQSLVISQTNPEVHSFIYSLVL